MRRRAHRHVVRFVVERDPDTGVLVGYVPGWPGAHTQGADVDELQRNLREVIEMLLEDAVLPWTAEGAAAPFGAGTTPRRAHRSSRTKPAGARGPHLHCAPSLTVPDGFG